jgi:hypothetical protein
MNKKMLAVSISAVLAVGFMAPAFMNAQAQVSSESRVLNTILALSNDINKKAQTLNNNLDNIDEDLLLKQKFWQSPPTECFIDVTEEEVHVDCNTVDDEGISASLNGPITRALVGFGPVNEGCDFADESACAFNVESAQIVSEESIKVAAIVTRDGVLTDISGKAIFTDTNLMVDMGIGKTGVSCCFIPLLEFFPGDEVTVEFSEFNGEKPQGMFLEFDIVIIEEHEEENEPPPPPP